MVLRRVVDTLAHAAGVPDAGKLNLYWLAGAFFGITVLQSIGRFGWRMFLIRASMLSGRDLRNRFGKKLFSLSANFYDQRRVGELMSLATQDCESVRQALGPGLLTFADSILYLSTVPIAMYFLSPKLTLIALIPLPLIFWFVSRNEKRIHDRYEQVQESFSTISAAASENLGGIRVVKAFGRENTQIDRFKGLGQNHVDLAMRLARVQAIFGPGLDFFMTLALVILLAWGGKRVIVGELSLGTFVAFRFYLQQMIWPMTALGFSIAHYQRAIASSDRLKEIFSAETNVPEPLHPQLPVDAPADLKARLQWKTAGKIELRNLSFSFPATTEVSAPLVLKGMNLTVEPGERVALIGAIGSGKSALLSLLPRIYPVSDGMLFLDEVDVNRWPIQELRNQVGYVGQDVFLFSETVSENVAFAHHERAPEEAIEFATQSASIHDDVLRLGEGYLTRLGERGVNLSGGQKQRLTLARALAKRPSVLLLDDALSAVDVQTEEKILSGLRSREGRNTEWIAAHRISTVKDADRIAVIEAGVITQLGSHSDLIRKRSGLYWRFYEQQRLKEDLESYVDRLDMGAESEVRS